jgi:hypothetical protein
MERDSTPDPWPPPNVSFPPLGANVTFAKVVVSIEKVLEAAIDVPYAYEQLTGSKLHSRLIRPLTKSLLPRNLHQQHRGIILALLVARHRFLHDLGDYAYIENGVQEARAMAAEIVAVRFLHHLVSDLERIEYLTFECPKNAETNELLDDLKSYKTSALEIAIVDDARKFLCSTPVEDVLTGIWDGKIVFWNEIKTSSVKTPHLYEHPWSGFSTSSKQYDMFARLRVPRYRAFFMMVNYAILLALFYALLFKTSSELLRVTWTEVILHLWFSGFVLDEIAQVRDAGSLGHYTADYWAVFDICIVTTYIAFFVLRVWANFTQNSDLASVAFDILSLEGLLLIPRFFSFLAIFPYYGTLFPCLKELAKEFVKFLTLIFILYLGFFTTFSFLGRASFSAGKMAWLLVLVFFGNSFTGFDSAPKISPVFGPPLMILFVTLTNILLITVLVSILSQRFSIMMLNAREEYVAMFASTVADSMSNSDRMSYFYPPLNIAGLILRPLRLFYTHNQFRELRVSVLKITHFPIALLVYAYEASIAIYERRVNRFRPTHRRLVGSF